MALHWPTFLIRASSAVVFAAVMLVGLLWKDWMFGALFITVGVLCIAEYFRLTEHILQQSVARALRICTIFTSLLWLCAVWVDSFLPVRDAAYSIAPALLFIPMLLLFSLLGKRGSLQNALAAVVGLAYIILPVALLFQMRLMHPLWPLILILCIWTNDTMAYLVGSLIGRTPFSPISPKKTWEGTAGGAMLTVAGAATWAYFSKDFSIRDVTAVATCAAVFGTLGDLFESKLKRLAGVKDSGNLMPGHGGALDRFDSLLVATPFAFCYLYLAQL